MLRHLNNFLTSCVPPCVVLHLPELHTGGRLQETFGCFTVVLRGEILSLGDVGTSKGTRGFQ